MTEVAVILAFGMIYYSSVTDGVPDSISSIAYVIPKWLFSVWVMAVGFLLMPSLMDVMSEGSKWMGFIMVFGMACVAASPYYKTEQVRLHYVGAAACFIFALMVVGMTRPWLLLMWVAYPFSLIGSMRKWWVMTAELICLTEIFLLL